MLNFQEMIAALTHFWSKQGCVVHQGYDLEVGAGTFNPATFLRCLGPEPYSAVYVEPSRRPKDGRYGENPNRVQFYHQMQVIMKPSPPNIQELYLKSLESIGLHTREHDIRFVHDDWENPTIGAWGLGWEVWADGMEITQFTYFQAIGGLPVKPVSGEITYGLERLAMYLQGVDSMFDLKWNEDIYYGDVFKRSEWEWSHYNFKEANAAMWLRHFDDFEAEAKRLISHHLPIPAYDFVMKASHAFNILDARGVISVTERTGYMARIRSLAKQLAEAYLKSREALQFPLLRNERPPLQPIQVPPVSSKWDPEEKEDFLLEIGSEELPAAFVPSGLNSLEKELSTLLKQENIPYDTLHAYGTPRRLALLVKGLRGGTTSQTIEKKGPSLAAAFDTSGIPTKAGEGFFRSLQLPTLSLAEVSKGQCSQIEIRTIQGTDYLFATLEIQGKSTRQILANALPSIILKVDFPKKMRWGNLEIEYARPLRWFVSLYGKEEIPFSVGNLLSGRLTFGHRQLAPESISLSHPKEYLEKLKSHFVMADIEERKATILSQLHTIEQEVKGKAIAQERVLPQVLHLVEWPFLTHASFDTLYLQAPKEVLISEMVEHQKYFPVADDQGNLLPRFIIVCNNTPSDTIRHGNQKALAPRLSDGLFLYREDLKNPLDDYREKLKSITFQKELGSLHEKVQRLIAYVEILQPYLPLCDLKKAKRAAALCKADLATELVGEFPELQGIVGRLYALHHGEDPEIADALDEHWMPKGEKGPLPKTSCGILLSLADKIDNFLSFFALELQPTSSSDPYALRRQALGLIKMVIEEKNGFPLKAILKECFQCFLKNPELSSSSRQKFQANQETIFQEIQHFLSNRLRTVFLDMGFSKDEIEAVLARQLDIHESYHLLTSLHAFRKNHPEKFSKILEMFTRSKKILLSQYPHFQKEKVLLPLQDTLLRHETEKALFKELQEAKKRFPHLAKSIPAGYEEELSLLAKLESPVASLFEAVKVIDDDLPIRMNRLALLYDVWGLCESVADFSKIQEH